MRWAGRWSICGHSCVHLLDGTAGSFILQQVNMKLCSSFVEPFINTVTAEDDACLPTLAGVAHRLGLGVVKRRYSTLSRDSCNENCMGVRSTFFHPRQLTAESRRLGMAEFVPDTASPLQLFP